MEALEIAEAIINNTFQGVIAQVKTIAKIEAALEQLGAAAVARGIAQRRG